MHSQDHHESKAKKGSDVEVSRRKKRSKQGKNKSKLFEEKSCAMGSEEKEGVKEKPSEIKEFSKQSKGKFAKEKYSKKQSERKSVYKSQRKKNIRSEVHDKEQTSTTYDICSDNESSKPESESEGSPQFLRPKVTLSKVESKRTTSKGFSQKKNSKRENESSRKIVSTKKGREESESDSETSSNESSHYSSESFVKSMKTMYEKDKICKLESVRQIKVIHVKDTERLKGQDKEKSLKEQYSELQGLLNQMKTQINNTHISQRTYYKQNQTKSCLQTVQAMKVNVEVLSTEKR